MKKNSVVGLVRLQEKQTLYHLL